MNARNRQTIGIIFVAALVAFLLALIPMSCHATTTAADEGFCEVVADAAQVAAKARNEGVLLGQYKSHIAHIGDPHDTGAANMRKLLDKISTVVYTSDDFAGLTPEQTMRYAYRTCMSVPQN